MKKLNTSKIDPHDGLCRIVKDLKVEITATFLEQ